MEKSLPGGFSFRVEVEYIGDICYFFGILPSGAYPNKMKPFMIF